MLVAKKISRTVEFLCAICRSIPIVSVQWIEDSVYNRKFVDPNDYLLKDTMTERRFGFRLETSLERAKEKKIFEGYTFVITSGITKMSFDQLKCMEIFFYLKEILRHPPLFILFIYFTNIQ